MSTQAFMPEKIVVALDGSDPSFKALSYATQLAALTRSRIIVLHVSLLPAGMTSKTLESLRKEMSTRRNEILEKAKSLAKAGGLDVEARAVETDNSVVMAIVEFAGQEKADLLVLGTRGTSGFGKLMLGSVAAGVVSFASCPVLAVR